jgi:hypothetical protein
MDPMLNDFLPPTQIQRRVGKYPFVIAYRCWRDHGALLA